MLKVCILGQHAGARGEVKASSEVHQALLPVRPEGVVTPWTFYSDGRDSDAWEVQLKKNTWFILELNYTKSATWLLTAIKFLCSVALAEVIVTL